MPSPNPVSQREAARALGMSRTMLQIHEARLFRKLALALGLPDPGVPAWAVRHEPRPRPHRPSGIALLSPAERRANARKGGLASRANARKGGLASRAEQGPPGRDPASGRFLAAKLAERAS